MSEQMVIEADLTWTGHCFEPDVQIVVNKQGRIENVGTLRLEPTHRLSNRAVLPGFVNAHSHAYQRGLRGRGEHYPQSQPGTFWSWREAMYALVEQLDPETVYTLSKQAFTEMRRAGVTTVGEFHYIHHDTTGDGYVFDEIVLRAARDVGIRLVLLQTYYKTGGIGTALTGGQKRFATPSLASYRQQFERLEQMIDPATQHLGVVAHSIRAAPLEDIIALHEDACRRGLPFHMHVEEQRKEIEQCLQTYHKTPMALLNAELSIDPRFTAVHCTHTASADMEAFLDAGGNVCICPLTEANLGDGLADIPFILKHAGTVCVGSDLNSRMSMTEELRWLEYTQRLAHEKRGVCLNEQGHVAAKLFEIGTAAGARSLGVQAGRIEPGALADFFTIDLDAPELFGWTPETLLESLIFGAGNAPITATCVGGRWQTADALEEFP